MTADPDHRRWAELVAATLDTSAWRDAERDASASTDEAERFAPAYARALLEHLRAVALDVLTTRQAAALGLVCEGELPTMIGPSLAATDFGCEVYRVREDYAIDDRIDAADRQRERGE